MAILPILKYPNSTLRKKAAPIKTLTPELQVLIDNMIATMYDAPGVGLAANQVGVLQQVLVYDISEEERKQTLIPHILINPKIIAHKGTQRSREACLSIPNFEEILDRYTEITVSALDRTGKPFTFTATKLVACVIQHEIDHLNGILILDRVSPLKRRLYEKDRHHQDP